MTTVEAGQQELRDLLREIGVPAPDWVAAYEAVPRELFLPEVIWPGDGRTAVSRADGPEEWRRWAYANTPLATQWDDGHHTGTTPGELATSSSSAPSLMFRMFAELSVADGMKAMEVGTGTGWYAALLSARLGEHNVTSVEDDPAQSQVYQGGPRDLWDEVEAAYRWWAGQKRPEHGEFGLTVTPDGRQEVWLREPSALLPRAAPTR